MRNTSERLLPKKTPHFNDLRLKLSLNLKVFSLHGKLHTSRSTSSRTNSGTFQEPFYYFCIFHLLETDMLFEDIVMFITGVRVVLPLWIPERITISFNHEFPKVCRCKLTITTCALKLSLPTHYLTNENMKKPILDSIKLSNGFDTIWTNISYHSIFPYILNLIYPQYR